MLFFLNFKVFEKLIVHSTLSKERTNSQRQIFNTFKNKKFLTFKHQKPLTSQRAKPTFVYIIFGFIQK
jgi:hypothetical protein